MKRISGFVILVLVLLTAGTLIAGCTDSAPANNSSAQTPATTISPLNSVLYTAGDIVRSPKSAAETGWLIIRYDSASDSYERAFIYKNDDGSWGYRVDARTETLGRSVLEKVNTVKVTHVDPSLVPQKKPVVTVSAVTPVVTSSGTVSTTSSPVTTGTIAMKPQIKAIAPENGIAGTAVSITC